MPSKTSRRSLRKNSPGSSKSLRRATEQTGARPPGGVLVGQLETGPLHLSMSDRSMHTLWVGATGSGKTTAAKPLIRQDLLNRQGMTVLDPMGPLVDDTLTYYAYLKATGRPVPELTVWDVSSPDWVLPFNPLKRREGDISVQADHVVSSILRGWNEHSGDQTPRLEKQLKLLTSAAIELGLTVHELALLIDQKAEELRSFLLSGLKDRFVRRKLEQLAQYRTADFLQQTESTENRLSRFLCSGALRRIMAPGTSAVDFSDIVEQGKVLLIKLRPSNYLSAAEARLIGTLILNEFYEVGLTRKPGSRPHHLWVDEAANFVSPELAQALEQFRQKGLFFNLIFQHPSQFKEQGLRVYKAVKNNCRNKFIFVVPDRQDAQELADDVFVGLADPELKYLHRHLSHLLEDIRQTSTTRTEGHSQTTGTSRTDSSASSFGQSQSHSQSLSQTQSTQTGTGKSRTFTSGHSQESGTSTSDSHSEHESHTSGFSESRSRSQSRADNSSETVHERNQEDWLSESEETSRSKTKGSSSSSQSSYSRTETGSDSYDSGDSHAESANRSTGSSRSVAFSRSRQRSETASSGQSRGSESGQSKTQTTSRAKGSSTQQETSSSLGTTDQPGVRHTPFWEEQPEFRTLEERKWMASEILMRQPVGHCMVSTAKVTGPLTIPKPSSFYIRPRQLEEFQHKVYAEHCITKEQAEQLILKRQEQLLAQAQAAEAREPQAGAASSRMEHDPRVPVWNRTAGGPAPPLSAFVSPPPAQVQARKRGPHPDFENHRKVERIVTDYGPNWATEEGLIDICERLDSEHVPIPKTWPSRRPPSRSWGRALSNEPSLVIKAIKDRLKAAQTKASPKPTNVRQLPLLPETSGE